MITSSVILSQYTERLGLPGIILSEKFIDEISVVENVGEIWQSITGERRWSGRWALASLKSISQDLPRGWWTDAVYIVRFWTTRIRPHTSTCCVTRWSYIIASCCFGAKTLCCITSPQITRHTGAQEFAGMQVGRKRFINYADIDLLPNYHSLSRNFRLPNYCLTRTVEHERVRLGRKPRCERCLQWNNLTGTISVEESYGRVALESSLSALQSCENAHCHDFYPNFRFFVLSKISIRMGRTIERCENHFRLLYADSSVSDGR